METKTTLDPLQKVQVLIDLGLTTAQAKVYLALVQNGISTAKIIAEISNVPRPEVYLSMDKLRKKGLVQTVIAKPSKYRATPANLAIRSLLQTKIRENHELQTKATTLIKEVTCKKEKKLRAKETEFLLIPKSKALIHRITEGVKNAEKSIYGVSSWNKWSCSFHTLAEEWKKAVKSRVEIRLVTDRPEKLIQLPDFLKWVSSKNYANFSLRCIPDTAQVSTMIFDSKQMFINTLEKNSITDDPALWSSNQCVIMVTQNYFESMWSKSSEHIFRTTSSKQKASTPLLK